MDESNLEVAITRAPSPAMVEGIWREIEDQADNSFFLSGHWINAWLQAARPNGFLIVAYCRGAPAGAAIAVRAPRSLRNPLRNQYRLHETGDHQVDGLFIEYNGVIGARPVTTKILSAMLSALEEATAKTLLQSIAVPHLIINAASPEFVDLVRRQYKNATVLRRDRSPFIDFERLRRERLDYLDALSANSRQQLRRARRAFESFGHLQLERARSVVQARDFLAGLKPLHIARWHSLGKRSGFDNPAFEPMLNALIASGVDTGAVDVLRITAGDRLLGYLVNFSYRGIVMNYTSGFAYGGDHRLKPGLVSHLLAIEQANASGAASYKFLAGGGRYKDSLSTDSEELVGLRIPLSSGRYPPRDQI